MATSKGKFYKGKPGVNTYTWHEMDCMRSNKAWVFMSSAMIDQQKLTGLCSKLGAGYRSLLNEVIPYPHDNVMQTQLRQALRRWLLYGSDHFEPPLYLPGFSFNQAAPLQQVLKLPVTFTLSPAGIATISIPALVPNHDIKAPAHTAQLACMIASATCDIKKAEPVERSMHRVMYDYNDKRVDEQKITLPLPAVKNTLTLVVMAIQCYRQKGSLSWEMSAKNNPCTVVGLVAR